MGKDLKRYSDMLHEAETKRTPIAPLTEVDPSLSIDDAYAIQLANVDRAVREGRAISGKKIGLTSPGIQAQFGVGEPDYGHLLDMMDCSATGDVPTDELLQPKIEGEIAFILKEDLDGGKITAADVRARTDHVVAAFEIVDSRIADWKIKLVDTVSDNASSGRYVLGAKELPIDAVDLPSVPMRLTKGGVEIASGTGAAVMGDPAEAVAWLANKMWSYGVTLKKGEVVLSGAFSAACEVRKGDEFVADFGPLGTVSARFI